jgi:glycosyltransferase involved in cell wall biosynthesis
MEVHAMPKLSLIVPCYNEEAAIPAFYRAATAVAHDLPQVTWEYIFVDDGSKDRTILLLRDLAAKDPAVRYLSFSRNFGKEAAMYAGLQAATGDLVAVLDADLQDPPSLLPEMLRILDTEGCDCVAVRRTTRKGEPPIRSFFARAFYRLVGRLSRTEIVDGARDFRLMRRPMVDSILRVTEYNRFSKGIFSWVGYDTRWLEVDNVPRSAGASKWSFFKLCVYALDGIIAFSTAPLAIASVLGLLFCLISFVAIVFVIVRQLIWGGSAYGWPSLVCIILFLTGIQLFCMGILGQYLSKVYLEVKDRPIYIIRESGGGDPLAKT